MAFKMNGWSAFTKPEGKKSKLHAGTEKGRLHAGTERGKFHQFHGVDPDAPGIPGTPGFEPPVRREDLDDKGKAIWDAHRDKQKFKEDSALTMSPPNLSGGDPFAGRNPKKDYTHVGPDMTVSAKEDTKNKKKKFKKDKRKYKKLYKAKAKVARLETERGSEEHKAAKQVVKATQTGRHKFKKGIEKIKTKVKGTAQKIATKAKDTAQKIKTRHTKSDAEKQLLLQAGNLKSKRKKS